MQSDRFAREIVGILALSYAARSRRLMRNPVGRARRPSLSDRRAIVDAADERRSPMPNRTDNQVLACQVPTWGGGLPHLQRGARLPRVERSSCMP